MNRAALPSNLLCQSVLLEMFLNSERERSDRCQFALFVWPVEIGRFAPVLSRALGLLKPHDDMTTAKRPMSICVILLAG
jgi:hypothetical protein